MNSIRPRLLKPAVLKALSRFPVVVVMGARQTGKTTLVAGGEIARGRTYRALDDYEVLERATTSPDALLQDAERMTIDEVQQTPDLLRAIKRAVDRSRVPGRFLLTGSANLLMMQRISESLAGRAVYLTLWPMTEAEKRDRAGASPWDAWVDAADAGAARGLAVPRAAVGTWQSRALAGGYPPAALSAEPGARAQWFDGYVRTYLERDLQSISSISLLPDFRRLMKLASIRVGHVLNQSELARDAALSVPTAHRYLNLLETSYQIVRLAAYATSRTKRLVKSPKLYWTDTGLAAHLAGLPPGAEEDIPGALLENLVLLQILGWRETAVPRPEIHYWRTQSGAEVDFVIESGRRLLPIEVKAARSARPCDAKGLEAFLDDNPERAPFGILLYGGREVLVLTERILAVPLDCVWG
ncbi:MAG TPA: ATP-binding protein [Planctomycetota bacterium]|nr:ATP-binding protein [Planctomycetota bacterium]